MSDGNMAAETTLLEQFKAWFTEDFRLKDGGDVSEAARQYSGMLRCWQAAVLAARSVPEPGAGASRAQLVEACAEVCLKPSLLRPATYGLSGIVATEVASALAEAAARIRALGTAPDAPPDRDVRRSVRVFSAALLWARSHIEGCIDPQLKHPVLSRLDAILLYRYPTAADMQLMRELFPIRTPPI